MEPLIRTYSGKLICPLDIKPEDIDIEDIIVAGSNICRFGGHVNEIYSVNEHQILCLRIMQELTNDKNMHFIALTHDICEIYSPIGDCLKPCKGSFFVNLNGKIISINEYEDYLQKIIIAILTNKTYDYNHPTLKLVDKIAVNTESLFLRGYKISEKYMIYNKFVRLSKNDVQTIYKKELSKYLSMI